MQNWDVTDDFLVHTYSAGLGWKPRLIRTVARDLGSVGTAVQGVCGVQVSVESR